MKKIRIRKIYLLPYSAWPVFAGCGQNKPTSGGTISQMTTLLLIASLTSTTEPLTHPLLEGLAMIESGALGPQKQKADAAKGRNGEVSRYQILPSVWAEHSKLKCCQPGSPTWAALVARSILLERINRYEGTYGPKPTLTQIYVLWNRPGYFFSDRAKMPEAVWDAAMRYEAVVESLVKDFEPTKK